MSEVKQLRYWQLTLQVIALAGVGYAVYHGLWAWLGWAVLMYCVYGFFGITICYHRMVAHHAFDTYAPIRYLLVFCGMACTISSPMTNALVHRTHHKFTDTEKDPHSPVVYGVRDVWFGDWVNEKPHHLDLRLIKKEIRDPFYQFTHKYFVPILMAFAVGLALIDWKAAAYLYCVPAAMMFHLKGFLNTLGHTWGYRTFNRDDHSRNSWLMHLATLGDGWHNNHHEYPSRWNTQVKWWEIDPAAWVIRLVKRR